VRGPGKLNENSRPSNPVADVAGGSLLRGPYIAVAACALATAGAAVLLGDLWFLNLVHVFSSLLWTGIDLFLGFVLGPVIRSASLSARAEIAKELTPRTLVLLPTLAIISGTTGWFLARELGYTALPWPAFGWVAGALALATMLAVIGFGILLPANVTVCLEFRKPNPDLKRNAKAMRLYFIAVALQGVLQIAVVIIMTRLRMGV
jgi:hypothetical protein